ncbi:MAG: peptidoglycan-associated lipoprotein Pal [Paracoccaceae bacterium]|nr:peptidoglycan-associated lipoprotein Pal [Paracoccaceae bacterium]
MTPTIKTGALLAAALLLSACASTQDRLSTAPATSAGALASGPLGDPTDPTSVAYFNQSVGDRVLFAVDQHTLTAEGESVLAAQANWLAQNPEFDAIIEGHADEQGTREYNLALGARRASSAQNFLIAQGVAPSRLRTVSYGKERPLAVCSDETCYQQNRRAVTVLSAGAVGF